jgi:hypothetical protein
MLQSRRCGGCDWTAPDGRARLAAWRERSGAPRWTGSQPALHSARPLSRPERLSVAATCAGFDRHRHEFRRRPERLMDSGKPGVAAKSPGVCNRAEHLAENVSRDIQPSIPCGTPMAPAGATRPLPECTVYALAWDGEDGREHN